MSGFGIVLLVFMGLVGLILLIEGLAAVSRFFEQGGFRTALDRLAYVNRESVYPPPESRQRQVPLVVPMAVPADTNAGSGDQENGTGTEPVPSVSHHMDDISIIALLAMQKDEDGEYRFSANEIAVLIGKRRAGTLEHVRSLRPVKKPTTAEPTFRPIDEHSRPVLVTKAAEK